jgi:acetyl-CoA C-acetyltransferase
MIEVVIAGIGQTKVGEHWDKSLRELALYSIEDAIHDATELRPQALFVANMQAPRISGQSHLGPLIADFAGMIGVEAYTVEAAGASGGAAMRAGVMAVASGQVDVALVTGVEKFTDQTTNDVENALATTLDSDYESIHGLTPTAQAALLMQRYMYKYGVEHSAFAGFPMVAHANGVGNPNAMFRRAIKEELYNRAGMVSAPLNMFDVAPSADGAASVILTKPELIPPGFPHPLIRIAGSSFVTAELALHDREDPLDFQAARMSVERACKQAKISPRDVDFFELYDAFSIYAALSLESAGFAGRGEGWKLAQQGKIGLDGEIPIAVMGGLKARGNPGGATGIYQIVESAMQLRDVAGDNQIIDARKAMVQSLGGPAASAATFILELVA